MFSISQLEKAAKDIYEIMPPTPQYCWPLLSQEAGCEVWLKHENHTPTGSFKVRGGLCLLHDNNFGENGIISATRGNHGLSLAFAGRHYNVPVTIIVPKNNSVEKNTAIKALGATLIEGGNDFDEARAYSAKLSKEKSLTPVLPFEEKLILGVATYAYEFFQAVKDLDTIYIPIGMGSGICGFIKVRDTLNLKTKIVGVVTENADAFAQSFEAKKIITTKTANTFADGLACKMPMQEAFDIISKGAERIIRVSETQIAEAIISLYKCTHNVAEGAGAASYAALLKDKANIKGKKVGATLSGGNIDLAQFSAIANNQDMNNYKKPG